jgi:prepilin-type N-terminal cleavage/methylation domain-containing protein/prepilin-type processing-associated H-X9-DG protein
LKRNLLDRILAGSSSERGAGFTLTELLVVIAIIAILFSLQWAGLAGAKSRTRVAQCAANLKQFTMVVELYGGDNNNKLPPNSYQFSNWAWDLYIDAFNDLVRYGATRNLMYCPAAPEQNNDGLWNFGGIHVIGYAVTFPGTASLAATNFNSSLIPQRTVFGPASLPPAPASKRVLLADATISQHGQRNVQNRMANTYTGINGSGIVVHHTSHLDGALPTGGNLGMLDGHVEWRKFNDMVPRTDPNATGFNPPVFWW